MTIKALLKLLYPETSYNNNYNQDVLAVIESVFIFTVFLYCHYAWGFLFNLGIVHSKITSLFYTVARSWVFLKIQSGTTECNHNSAAINILWIKVVVYLY